MKIEKYEYQEWSHNDIHFVQLNKAIFPFSQHVILKINLLLKYHSHYETMFSLSKIDSQFEVIHRTVKNFLF